MIQGTREQQFFDLKVERESVFFFPLYVCDIVCVGVTVVCVTMCDSVHLGVCLCVCARAQVFLEGC